MKKSVLPSRRSESTARLYCGIHFLSAHDRDKQALLSTRLVCVEYSTCTVCICIFTSSTVYNLYISKYKFISSTNWVTGKTCFSPLNKIGIFKPVVSLQGKITLHVKILP